MVAEGIVLLRVKRLKECGGRIAAKSIKAHLINFIKHKDGVAGAGGRHTLNNPARKRAHIGAAVAPDLRFVADAAQGLL